MDDDNDAMPGAAEGKPSCKCAYRNERLPETVRVDDAVFFALADATRRELLDRLGTQNGQRTAELCNGLPMSRQAVAKHLRVLEESHLITSRRFGRETRHLLVADLGRQVVGRWADKLVRWTGEPAGGCTCT